MGRTVTTVGTTVTRVIEDDRLPNAVRTGVLKALFEDEGITEYILEDLANSIGVRGDRLYTYAQANYHYGLPSGEIYSSTQGRQQVEAIIEAAEGQQVLIEYSHYGPANALHVGWMKLVASYGYDSATNQLATLTAQKGRPVYLKNMEIVVPTALYPSVDPRVLQQWGTAPNAGYTPERLASDAGLSALIQPSPVVVDYEATALHLRATVIWQGGTGQYGPLLEEQLMLTLDGYSDIANFFHAKYTVNGLDKYWIYRDGAGTYPTLDAVFGPGLVESGSYFPFIHFRTNKQSLISTPDAPGYLTAKRTLKKLDIDYDTIAEAIDENPGIADVEQAFLTFAVPPTSTDPIENRYLFEYFDTLYYAIGDETPWQWVYSDSALYTRHTITIQDALFRMALGMDRVTKRMVSANIGAVGTCSSAKRTDLAPVQVFEWIEVNGQNQGALTTTITQVPVYTYRKQVSANLCEEIEVFNLKMMYWIWDDYATTSDTDEKILLIPIDRTIIEGYAIKDRETLYARSLHLVFNSRVVTPIKWYQTPEFRVVMIAVAVIITIYSAGADGGSSLSAALGLSGAAGVLATIIFNVIIVGKVIGRLFALFVKAVGVEVAVAIAILAIAYGAYQIIDTGSLTGTWAPQLLSLANGLQQAVVQVKLEEVLEERSEFEQESQNRTKMLESARELLENTSLISPFVIFGEKPEDYFNRTVHFGNIGTLGYTAVSSYVDLALTLPKLNDTFGEELNG